VEVLGKQFSPAFGRFVTQAKAELGQEVEFVDRGAGPPDGAEDDPSAPASAAGAVRIAVDPALPNGAAELVAARQLAARLVRARKYPQAGPLGHGVAPERQEERAAAVQRVADALAGEVLLREAGLDTAALAAQDEATGTPPELAATERPARGTDAYLNMQLDLIQRLLLADPKGRADIERAYRSRVPGIVGDVKGAVTRVAKIGWETHEQAGRALAVLILMLGLHDQLCVMDAERGEVLSVTARQTDGPADQPVLQS
jgi:hypothetical protein